MLRSNQPFLRLRPSHIAGRIMWRFAENVRPGQGKLPFGGKMIHFLKILKCVVNRRYWVDSFALKSMLELLSNIFQFSIDWLSREGHLACCWDKERHAWWAENAEGCRPEIPLTVDINMYFPLTLRDMPRVMSRASSQWDGLSDPTNRSRIGKCCSEALTYFLEQMNRLNSDDLRRI